MDRDRWMIARHPAQRESRMCRVGHVNGSVDRALVSCARTGQYSQRVNAHLTCPSFPVLPCFPFPPTCFPPTLFTSACLTSKKCEVRNHTNKRETDNKLRKHTHGYTQRNDGERSARKRARLGRERDKGMNRLGHCRPSYLIEPFECTCRSNPR